MDVTAMDVVSEGAAGGGCRGGRLAGSAAAAAASPDTLPHPVFVAALPRASGAPSGSGRGGPAGSAAPGPVDVALLEAVVSECVPGILTGTAADDKIVALFSQAVDVVLQVDPSVADDRCALRHIFASLMRGGAAVT